ncbi:hypothetical protein [Burkholderia sola]|uniref:hypothetical protein n=1 Tax=Burkholderia sola TaxID=2843302 RepID=UPI00338DCC82
MTKAHGASVHEGWYVPVRHTAADTARMLADSAVKAAYDQLEEEFAALRALLSQNQPGPIGYNNLPR